MADRVASAPRDPRVAAGIVALAAISLLIGGAFAGLIVEGVRDLSGAIAAFDPYLIRVARF
ncbi:MAG: thiamine/thiamine pyrophosphate ABC transporter permease ThiP, partial [Aquamicrobium sp.]|nr:thiamine/thiamine pyrophosphate ABC transporter permease ThiP [Aquamicrobium sp.]